MGSTIRLSAIPDVQSRWSFLSLRRITSGGDYIPEVDGLRFVAIASVVWYHIALKVDLYSGKYIPGFSRIADFFMNMLMHGYEGVGIFFVISGFILGLPFARWYLCNGKPVGLRPYFWRRITRLEPPYIINLIMRLPLIPAGKHMTFRQVIPHFVASLVYLHVFIFGYQPIVHWASWSLEIEVQFYILAPLFAAWAFRSRPLLRRIALGILVIGAGFLQIYRPDGLRWEMSILNYGQFFLAGFLVADLYVTSMPRWRQSYLWDVISIPLWILVFSAPIKTAHILIPPAAVILLCGAFKGKLLKAFFRLSAVSTIGGMCYSIYLTHPLLMDGCFAVISRISALKPFWSDLIIAELLVSVAILIGGAIFFILIERPCMDKNWPRKLRSWFRERHRFRGSAGCIQGLQPGDQSAVNPRA